VQRRRLALWISAVAMAMAAVPAPSAVAEAADPTIVVASGDTLIGISRRHGVSVDQLVALNGLADPGRIYAGQRLVIGRATATPKPAAKPAAAAPRTHLVADGENLTFIARRYGVTIAAIVAANRLADPSRIYAGQRLVIPGASPSTGGASSIPAEIGAATADRDPVRRILIEGAKRFSVPAALALAVAWQESGWRQDVVSPAGAIGVMQLLPDTGQWVGDVMLQAPVDLRDPRENVRAGVRLLRHYLDRYHGSLDLTLAAYYQGQTAADRHGVYAMTRPYIASIKGLIRVFGG
jgi:soluble lytic murein transglycosylase-like protein